MAKTYNVILPVVGSICITVEVSDDATEEEILDMAHEQQEWNIDTGNNTEPMEFETLNRICNGNVCYAPVHQFEIEEA